MDRGRNSLTDGRIVGLDIRYGNPLWKTWLHCCALCCSREPMEVHPLMEYPHWKCGMNGYMDEINYGSSRDAHPTEMGMVDHRWQAN